MLKPPKVLLLTGSYGNGHLEVAHALVAELNKRGIADIVVSDLFYEAHPILTSFTKQLYLKSFTKGQSIYGFLYYNSDYRMTDFRIDRIIDRYGYVRINQLMNTHDFDVVINTFPMQALPIYKQKNQHTVPFVNVLTDFCLHTRWVSDEINHFFVACGSLKEELLELGIDGKKITISGIPIKEAFYQTALQPLDSSSVNQNQAAQHVLISAGAFGVLKNLPALINKLSVQSNLILTVICGRNEELYHSLSIQYDGVPTVRILSYVNDMAALMKQADVMVTKSGGISLSEALALQVPLVLTPAVPGQERDNANLFEQEGMAITTRSEDEIVPAVLQVLKQPFLADHLKTQMSRHFYPYAAATIVDSVLDIIEETAGVKENNNENS
ncbi:MAG: glycosyltransferase [Carnobacterium sp.]|uniref:MGDG synthase family glycosyltransferase n=1 Tax=Carnobacterium sp. TaxID=48221 RepID=UPI002FCB0594